MMKCGRPEVEGMTLSRRPSEGVHPSHEGELEANADALEANANADCAIASIFNACR